MSLRMSRVASLTLVGGMAFAAAPLLNAQSQPLPEGYIARSPVTARGLAPKMKVKQLGPAARTFQIVFSKGDEVASGLTEFAEKNHIQTAHFTAIGAFDSAIFGWADPEKRAYKSVNKIDESKVA